MVFSVKKVKKYNFERNFNKKKELFSNRKNFFLVFFIFLFIFFPASSQAFLQSENYIIKESITYFGVNSLEAGSQDPVISNISCSPGTNSATITWVTDIVADSFVIYDTDINFNNSREQGKSAKTSTNHSIALVGLSAGTKYYYKVKSTSSSGGISISSIYTCTTQAEESASQESSSGGVIIVDKTDKVAPAITNVVVSDIKSESVIISWETDEESSSFVEYGKGLGYGDTFGKWDSTTSHSVKLKNLLPETEYNFRVLSSDSWGNLAMSGNKKFITVSYKEEWQQEEKKLEKEQKENGKISEKSLLSRLEIIKKMSEFFPGAVISGKPEIEAKKDKAFVSWQSSKRARSYIAYASESEYKPDNQEPYKLILEISKDYSTKHKAELVNLLPGTRYHFQIRMNPIIGPESKSEDFVFTTKPEGLEIKNYYIDLVNLGNVRFKWVTNKEADSTVKTTPYRRNNLSLEEIKVFRENKKRILHDVLVRNIEAGVNYNIEMISMDDNGNIAIKTVKKFNIGDDNEGPILNMIQTNSTLFADKKNKVQTIISWLTNEPATTRIYYSEGVKKISDNWPQATELDEAYTKNHIVVLNNFQPGKIYSFRAESTDSSGNTSISQVFTFITPKREQSIFQLIVSIFENLFGWAFNKNSA